MSTASESDSRVPPEKLDFYTLRDEIAHHYNPVGPLEAMLVTQIVQAWMCLQRAYGAQRRYFEANDVLEAIEKHFPQYKAVNREVANCERAWRHAVVHLEKMQRRRLRNGLAPRPILRPFVNSEPEPAGTSPVPRANPARVYQPCPAAGTGQPFVALAAVVDENPASDLPSNTAATP